MHAWCPQIGSLAVQGDAKTIVVLHFREDYTLPSQAIVFNVMQHYGSLSMHTDIWYARKKFLVYVQFHHEQDALTAQSVLERRASALFNLPEASSSALHSPSPPPSPSSPALLKPLSSQSAMLQLTAGVSHLPFISRHVPSCLLPCPLLHADFLCSTSLRYVSYRSAIFMLSVTSRHVTSHHITSHACHGA